MLDTLLPRRADNAYRGHSLALDVVLQFLPIARTGAPPGLAINLAFLGVIVAGLALSLWNRATPSPPPR